MGEAQSRRKFRRRPPPKNRVFSDPVKGQTRVNAQNGVPENVKKERREQMQKLIRNSAFEHLDKNERKKAKNREKLEKEEQLRKF